MRENSLRDGLTGCFNRTHAIEVIDTELRRARRSQAPVSLIMFDIDHFKEINDRYGHLCGDAVLAAVGARMRDVLRGSDLKCRYGGEEFLVLLPETPLEGAKRVAETLRRELADMQIAWKDETAADHRQLRRDDGAAVGDRRAGAHRPRRRGALSRQGSGTQLRAARDRSGSHLGPVRPIPARGHPFGPCGAAHGERRRQIAERPRCDALAAGLCNLRGPDQTTRRPLTSRTRNSTTAMTSRT